MGFKTIKKILKSNHVKFLLAICVSILIHLFLLGGIDIYNPFFLKNSYNLNIVIESHLESPEKKEEVMKNLFNLLFKKNDAIVINKLAKKVDKTFKEIKAPIVVGSTVKLKKNYQVGEVMELKGKRVVVKVGQIPMSIEMDDLIVVEKLPDEVTNTKKHKK